MVLGNFAAGRAIRALARSNPVRPLLGLLLRSFSVRHSAAATRSRARSRSATVYRRGSGRVRFLRGPCAALLARMIEPIHSERFVAILDKNYPTWREARAELNELPLTAEIWNE